jgi:hypothetical protein
MSGCRRGDVEDSRLLVKTNSLELLDPENERTIALINVSNYQPTREHFR